MASYSATAVRWSAKTLLLLTFAFIGTPTVWGQAKEDQEPPQIFFLEAGDKKISVDLDKPFSLTELGGQTTLTLRSEPYRVFNHAGLNFQYPREFSFSADLENEAVSIWSLNGTNAVVIVQRYPGRTDADAVRKEFIQALAEQYKEALKGQTAVALPLKSGNLQGTRLKVDRAGAALIQDVFTFVSGNNVVLLLLQDAPQQNNQPSAEQAKVQKMLLETFSVPQK